MPARQRRLKTTNGPAVRFLPIRHARLLTGLPCLTADQSERHDFQGAEGCAHRHDGDRAAEVQVMKAARPISPAGIRLNLSPGNCTSVSAADAVAASRIFFAFYPDLDNICGSANPGIDLERTGRTIGYAGTAFHAGVKIDNDRFSALHLHDMLRTDLGAKAAADAFFRIQDQRTHIFDVPEGFHLITFLFRAAHAFGTAFPQPGQTGKDKAHLSRKHESPKTRKGLKGGVDPDPY